MHPTLLELPSLGITIASYHACILLAVVVCFAIGPRWVAALEGLDARQVLRAMLLVGVAVFVGARLHFVLNHWEDFADQPLTALRIWSGGLHAGGGIVALALATPLILSWLGLPAGRFADGFAPTVGIGIAIARVGCSLHGCCFGTLCSLPWGVTYPRNTYIYQYHADLGVLPPGAEQSLPIHPLQLYFVAAGLTVTAVAVWLHARKRYDGEVALVSLVVFSTSTAALEFLRADAQPNPHWWPPPPLMWMAFAMSVAALAALVAAELTHRRDRARFRPSTRGGIAKAPLPRQAPPDVA